MREEKLDFLFAEAARSSTNLVALLRMVLRERSPTMLHRFYRVIKLIVSLRLRLLCANDNGRRSYVVVSCAEKARLE